MKPARGLTVAILVAVCLGGGRGAFGQGGARFSDRTLFVHFTSHEAAHSARQVTPPLLAAIGARVEWASDIVPGLAVVRVEDPRMLDLAETLAGAQRDVELVERDPLGRPTGVTPNDPKWPDQYGAQVTCFPGAWTVRTKSTVLIAVIGSGVAYTQPDLAGNMWFNSAEHGHDEDGSGIVGDYYGASFISDPTDHNYTPPNDPTDHEGHETGVASVLGAVGNNSDGMCGGAWQCTMFPVKIWGDRLVDSDAVKGMEYAINRGARLMNCSFTMGSTDSAAVRKFLQLTPEALYVFAAGNDGIDLDGTAPPGGCHFQNYFPQQYPFDNLLVVGGTSKTDGIWNDCAQIPACFCGGQATNYGAVSVDFLAPASHILHLQVNPLLPNNPGTYHMDDGTSYAAPLTTAVAAMVWTEHPAWTPFQVKQWLMGTCDRLPQLAGSCVVGYPTAGGRLNAAAALGTSCN